LSDQSADGKLLAVTDAGSADVRAFYEGRDEATRRRTGEGRVELLRTQQILRGALAPGSRILDIGGADGAHAEWLEGDGHRVEVVDLVPRHVEGARARGLTAQQGDARDVPHRDDSFDAVLMLGPLYHLTDPSHRATALAEAHRVLRPEGLLAVSAMNSLAIMLEYLREGPIDAAARAVAAGLLETCIGDSTADTPIFAFHTDPALRRELCAAGFGDISVRGLEGPAWPLLDPAGPPDDPFIEQVVHIAELADRDDAFAAVSGHLLALARAETPHPH
jgi:SAM-dependent methyltransferase